MAKAMLLGLALFTTVSTNTNYHSQFAQDKWLNENIFMNKTGSTFVDVGTADGIEINNTLFFEVELEWNEICIEALPEQYKKTECKQKLSL